ncbi:MAG: OB-fold domain-containing protein [Pseudomonadales bacterium]
MAVQGEYLGMPIAIDDLDGDYQAFFRHCAQHELHLQCCDACGLLRYPLTTACPFCAQPEFTWKPASGKGTLYSYGEVHHVIQPVFRAHSPYLLLLVELDEQRGEPNEFDGLRVSGNLVTDSGELAPPELVERVGIGTRLRIVFVDAGEGIAIPQWTIDEEAEQPASPWRYPDT